MSSLGGFFLGFVYLGNHLIVMSFLYQKLCYEVCLQYPQMKSLDGA